MKATENFNSRAHVERDRNTLKILKCSKNFNSRAHVERDKICLTIPAYRSQFQLTRSRGARPYANAARSGNEKISTHALTWSATEIR